MTTIKSAQPYLYRAIAAAPLLLSLYACQSMQPPFFTLPEPLRGKNTALPTARAETSPKATQKITRMGTEFSRPPRPPQPAANAAGLNYKSQNIKYKAPKLRSINVESMPLPAYINEIYGNILGLSFKIDPSLQTKTDLLSVRINEPQTPDEIFRTSGDILADYGVTVEAEGNLLRFTPSTGKPGTTTPPLLVSGRALPNVPVSHRPLFQLVPLNNVRNSQVRGWLSEIYAEYPMKISEDPERNALLLSGAPDIVEQAVEAVKVLDQPSMRGRYSLKIEPMFLSADELSLALTTVLNSEGYGVSNSPPIGSILIVPIKKTNIVLAFAAEEPLLRHIEEWAKELDTPGEEPVKDRFFYTPIKNTSAEELVTVISAILTSSVSSKTSAGATPATTTAQTGKTGASTAKAGARSSGPLVADSTRNAILYYGDSETWQELLPIIRMMDVPTKQVLIEVTIAEVTLTNEENFGIEWLVKAATKDFSSDLSTLGGLGLSAASGGLSYVVASAGQTRLMLNALASDQRVNILSTPRVLVKSGSEANMEVGTEVPIVSSQATAADLNNTTGTTGTTPSILQNIQYRKTGVILNVTPIVHAGQHVDMKISQEISAAQNNKTSSVNSPSILNRKVETELSLDDGSSVLLGGLIGTDSTIENKGIPYLRNIPYLGRLFSVDAETRQRTELMMLIVPYVLNAGKDAEAITKEFKTHLQGVGNAGKTLKSKGFGDL